MRIEAAMSGDKTGRVKQRMDQWTAEQTAEGGDSTEAKEDDKGQGEMEMTVGENVAE